MSHIRWPTLQTPWHIWMSYVSHMNESRHPYKEVISHIKWQMSQTPWHIGTRHVVYECVVLHMSRSHVTHEVTVADAMAHMNESSLRYEWVTSHIEGVTWHIEGVMSYQATDVRRRGRHGPYEWAMSHIRMSRATHWKSHVTHEATGVADAMTMSRMNGHGHVAGSCHLWMSHVPFANESRHTYEGVMAHIRWQTSRTPWCYRPCSGTLVTAHVTWHVTHMTHLHMYEWVMVPQLRVMSHWLEWNASTICVTWLTHLCDMSRLSMWHGEPPNYDHMCVMPHSHENHDSCTCVTWLIDMRDIRHSNRR